MDNTNFPQESCFRLDTAFEKVLQPWSKTENFDQNNFPSRASQSQQKNQGFNFTYNDSKQLFQAMLNQKISIIHLWQ